MPLILDHAVSPPEGHHLIDPSGVTIRAGSIQALLTAITSYRAQNGQPAGQPELEVERYYRDKYPWLISKVGTTAATPEDPVVRWLNRAWRTPIKDWAESETVNARLATCGACEHYAPDHPFDREATRRLIILGAGKLRAAGACKVHHWACGLAVLAREREEDLRVDGCWVKPRLPL